jgi:hypothetical protein
MVISGAQVGADIAGLRAAKACGIPTGGWMPKGFRTLNGPLDPAVVEEFGLSETESPGYPMRTEKNVVSSDATIRLAHDWFSAGERLTLKLIEKHARPRLDVELRRIPGAKWSSGMGGFLGWSVKGAPLLESRSHALNVAEWLNEQETVILNIAGNGDESIERFVEWFLTLVFINLQKMA